MSKKLSKPSVEIVPSRPAVCRDQATELFVLVRIVPPVPETAVKRPPLNLGLVIDRSGSMAGFKLSKAKEEAIDAVRQLNADDRVSVTIYDDTVETIVTSTLADDKAAIMRRIERIETGGRTDLHAGWMEGGIQVSQYLHAKGLNRVLLLTDGLANAGETNQARICSDVRGLAQRGVSTSAVGVGDDYNENLIQAMSRSGDGSYYHRHADRREGFFAEELQDLMAAVGHTVSLGLEPQGGAEVTDVLNDLDRNTYGRLLLPNLIAGRPIEVVAKLTVPPRKREADACFTRLAWSVAGLSERQVMREVLSLPAVPASAWAELAEDQRVLEAVARLEAARIRQRAIEDMERGDISAARQSLQQHADYVRAAAPAASWLSEELQESADLDASLAGGEVAHATKAAKFANYRKRRSR